MDLACIGDEALQLAVREFARLVLVLAEVADFRGGAKRAWSGFDEFDAHYHVRYRLFHVLAPLMRYSEQLKLLLQL